MSSVLCDPILDNAPVWCSVPTNLANLPYFDTHNPIEYLNTLFEYDNDGNPKKYMEPGDMTLRGDDKDGFQGMMKTYRTALTKRYGKEYDVLTWQYDWRESNLKSAEKLTSFVEKNNYTDIVFIAHSNGGSILSKFFANSENRRRVSLFLAFGVPFFGSTKAASMLFDSNGYDEGNILDVLMSLVNLKTHIANIPTVYQLIPTRDFSSFESENKTLEAFSIDGKRVTYNEIIEFMKEQGFAQRADGTVKKALTSLLDYQNLDYVETDNGITHVTNLVPTEFFIGNGTETLVSINLSSENGSITNKEFSSKGDGTVYWYSATAGHLPESENVHVFEGVEHSKLLEESTLNEALSVIAKYVEKKD